MAVGMQGSTGVGSFLAVLLAETLPIPSLLVAIVFVYGFVRQKESLSPQEFAPLAGTWVGPIGGFLATLLFGVVGRTARSEAKSRARLGRGRRDGSAGSRPGHCARRTGRNLQPRCRFDQAARSSPESSGGWLAVSTRASEDSVVELLTAVVRPATGAVAAIPMWIGSGTVPIPRYGAGTSPRGWKSEGLRSVQFSRSRFWTCQRLRTRACLKCESGDRGLHWKRRCGILGELFKVGAFGEIVWRHSVQPN